MFNPTNLHAPSNHWILMILPLRVYTPIISPFIFSLRAWSLLAFLHSFISSSAIVTGLRCLHAFLECVFRGFSDFSSSGCFLTQKILLCVRLTLQDKSICSSLAFIFIDHQAIGHTKALKQQWWYQLFTFTGCELMLLSWNIYRHACVTFISVYQ